MKENLYILSALLLLYSPIFAQQVSPETAQHVANVFLQNNVSPTTRSVATSTTTNSTSTIKPIGKVAQSPAMYAVSQDNVWVLVSADERVTPILAYSDANAGMFPEEEDMPDGMIALLDWYEQQIQYLKDSTNIATLHEDWENYQTTSNVAEPETIISPLLYRNGEENIWKQYGNNEGGASNSTSYNKFCPRINAFSQLRTAVGCVAVAMGQVMWYWQWPQIAIVEQNNGNKLIREYKWDHMPAQLTNTTPIQDVDMIAHLLHDAGVSVDMNYGPTAIGGSTASPIKIPIALRNIFGYYCGDKINRDMYPTSWLDILKNNLNRGFPILYGGCTSEYECHRYVIDGYNSQNAFHVNYGHGGDGNGYYILDTIINTSFEFYKSQNAIFDIYPHYPDCSPHEISQNEMQDTIFVIQSAEETTTIGNVVVDDYQDGVICSNERIKLTSGFYAKAGSNLCITIKDIPCDSNSHVTSLPQKKKTKENTSYIWCNQWNVLSHYIFMSDATTWIYQLGKDTVINQQTYSRLTLWSSKAGLDSENYISALRFTEDKKVYIHYEDTEYLLYDFDVEVGDTIEVFSGIQNHQFDPTYTHVITGIETLSDGRLQVESNVILKEEQDGEIIEYIRGPIIWIEGVGSTNGIVNNPITLRDGGAANILLCAYRDAECIYITDKPKYTPLGCIYNEGDIVDVVESVITPTGTVQKMIYNGQLLIVREGKTYNVMGVELGE